MKDKMHTYFKTIDEDQKNVLKSCAIVLLVTSTVGIASLNFLGAFFALLASRLIIPKFFANRNQATFEDGKIVCEKRNKTFALKAQKIYMAVCIVPTIAFVFLFIWMNADDELGPFLTLLSSFLCTNLYLFINKIPPVVMFTETSFFKSTTSKEYWDWYDKHSMSKSWSSGNVHYKMFD